MRYAHNRVLHGWGIAEGFDVAIAEPGRVEVRSGFAIDREGREIVLEQALLLDVGTPDLPDEQASYFVTASWEQLPDEFGDIDPTRWLEWPGVSVATEPPSDPGRELLLARVVSRAGELLEIDGSQRRRLGRDAEATPEC